jgi:glycosyltransferase involved in cell wall biosynthesis
MHPRRRGALRLRRGRRPGVRGRATGRQVKVLQTNFHRGWGGQPARILMLCRGLQDRGVEVTIAAPAGSLLAERARAAGIAIFEGAAFRKPKFLRSAIRDVRALTAHLRTARYDLIDSHGSQDLWTTVLARRLASVRTPLVFTRHNSKRIGAHTANRWLYRQVDHLILVSDSIRERYEPLFASRALRRDRVSVIHSAYRTDRFHPGLDASRGRRALGVPPEVPLVGAVGRLVADKGQDDLIRAAVEVRRRHPAALFLLVGTGTAEPLLRDLAARLGVSEAVRFLGFRDDVPEITAALDLSVLAAVDCDASSAVLKEAHACGVPVVATAIGGAGEIVRDGETGLIVPPRDSARLAAAILRLLGDPARAREMGRRGSLDVASRFTPDRLADETLAVYRAVVRERRNVAVGSHPRKP